MCRPTTLPRVGPPVDYPYPPVYYPPSTGAVIAAGAISFGIGVAVGAFWGGGWNNWGWHCGWGHNNVVINNNFINNNHFNHVNIANGNNWVHNPAHRGGVPYANHNVSNRFNSINGNRVTRPTAAQTEQRFNQMQQHSGDLNGRGAGPAQGGANRMGPQGGAGMGGDRIGNRNVGGGGGHGAFGGMNQGGFRTQMNRIAALEAGAAVECAWAAADAVVKRMTPQPNEEQSRVNYVEIHFLFNQRRGNGGYGGIQSGRGPHGKSLPHGRCRRPGIGGRGESQRR